jgi:tRNA pseudouridine13 synthase
VSEAALPRAHGDAVLAAKFRVAPEDFVVDEIDAFEASGAGEHLLLTVEKRGMNTAFAARKIAAWAGVAESAIGYAGLKDRHALTRQRFSVWIPKKIAPDIEALQSEDLRVLDARWHARKMPRGALAGNRFALTLRDVEGDRDAIEARISAIAARGVPNYFGEQRFGRGGDNVSKALSMFAGRRVAREERGHLLSAARSEVFNRVLAARVRAASWDSRSVFGPEPWNDTLAERLARFDIHPSGPLWGRGALRSEGEARALELAMLEGDRIADLCAGLERAGLEQERRALRMRPDAFGFDWIGPHALRLHFSLQAGCYATAVLAELGTVADSAVR